MELINKSTVVAEITNLKVKYECGWNCAIDKVLEHIDDLEVKEVNLDEAARKWEDKVYLEKGWQDEYGTPHAPFSEIGNAFREGAKFMIKAQKGE